MYTKVKAWHEKSSDASHGKMVVLIPTGRTAGTGTMLGNGDKVQQTTTTTVASMVLGGGGGGERKGRWGLWWCCGGAMQ
ncbi:hypothetical protein L1987_06523 [Smallanthus sonchifolius]|uniref:Uncharacterized protein n=1 Tax=Smallanthus sonchifolius TaxID=185202 RepID=A0ACB9JYH7_9ASTR|nr:hypothetical protein L1987_06523 [Smallanthus sonchifolius]